MTNTKDDYSLSDVVTLGVVTAVFGFLAAILVMLGISISQWQGPDAVAGNSAYLATSGTCIPAVLDSGTSSCIGASRVYNVRSFTVNPGKCYLLDGSTRYSSRGNLPGFYTLGAGAHWFRACP